MNRLQTLAAAVALTFFSTLTASAGEDVNTDKTGVAIGGYDPVAYFVDNEASRGNFQIAANHQGATYWFTSEDNLKTFQADPTQYLPQYGGYCAFGAAIGRKFSASPEVFKIVDQKLYLNLNADIASKFNEEIAINIDQADETWPQIKDVPAAEIK